MSIYAGIYHLAVGGPRHDDKSARGWRAEWRMRYHSGNFGRHSRYKR